jgi:hypothetical protein
MTKFFIGWGSFLCLLLGGFNFFGWTLSSPDLVLKDQPKSVRDNPGTYKPSYRTHYTGGK